MDGLAGIQLDLVEAHERLHDENQAAKIVQGPTDESQIINKGNIVDLEGTIWETKVGVTGHGERHGHEGRLIRDTDAPTWVNGGEATEGDRALGHNLVAMREGGQAGQERIVEDLPEERGVDLTLLNALSRREGEGPTMVSDHRDTTVGSLVADHPDVCLGNADAAEGGL
jgi:hypothetical protein